MYLSKKQLIQNFKDMIMPALVRQHEPDHTLNPKERRKAWTKFVDGMRDEGYISTQGRPWGPPAGLATWPSEDFLRHGQGHLGEGDDDDN